MEYLSFDPAANSVRDTFAMMTRAIGPRPIAFASTVDAEGRPNLAPFSYFNVFSTVPPLAIFAPVRSGRTGRTKHTSDNCAATGEVCINLLSYSMVHQQNLASVEFEAGVNEFIKAGLTPEPSTLIKPARVAESPVQLECRVHKIEELGEVGGAGVLVFVEILRIHFRADVLDENGIPDPNKMDLIARMGDDWYCRAAGTALFRLPKPPLGGTAIGFDGLPAAIRNSAHLTGNQLAQFASLPALPVVTDEHIKQLEWIVPDFVHLDEDSLHRHASRQFEYATPENILGMLLAYHGNG